MPGPFPARGSMTTMGRRLGSTGVRLPRQDAGQVVVHGTRESPAVHDDFVVEDKNRRFSLPCRVEIVVPPPA